MATFYNLVKLSKTAVLTAITIATALSKNVNCIDFPYIEQN